MMKPAMFVLIGGLAACGGKKSDAPASGSAAKSAEGAPAPAPAPSGPFGAWDMDARTRAWQGAWAGTGEAIGMKAAWQIDGAKATYVDASGTKTRDFSVDSPCSATFTDKSPDGSTSGTTTTYTIKDGALITGLGDAGSRRGASAVVCGAGTIFTLDAKGCTAWHDDFGHLASEPGECGIRQVQGKDVFWYKAMGSETVLAIDGDVIWSDQLRDQHATRQPDLAAAKKAQGF